MGEKAWWLSEMIAMVPPSTWCDAWGKTPTELIQAVGKSEWKEAVLLGWSHATQRHVDPDWAEALARRWFSEGDSPHRSSASSFSILEQIPAQRMEALILLALETDQEPLYDGHPAFRLLRSFRTAWTAPLSRTVVRSLRQRISQGENRDRGAWELRPSLKEFALRVPPALADEFSAGWPTEAKEWDAWAGLVDNFLSLLQFRHEMLKEIDS
jgi:hypothetical protein